MEPFPPPPTILIPSPVYSVLDGTKVHSDIMNNMDKHKATTSSLLDLSAAFDTVYCQKSSNKDSKCQTQSLAALFPVSRTENHDQGHSI